MRAAVDRVRTARSPHELLEAADLGLRLAGQLQTWPFGRPTRESLTAELHGHRGQALFDLARVDPVRYCEPAIEAMETAQKLLQPLDRSGWAIVAMNLSIVYANRLQQRGGPSMDRAIQLAEAALAQIDRSAAPIQWAEGMMNLASYYMELQTGDPAKNVEHARQVFAAIPDEPLRTVDPQKWAALEAARGMSDANRLQGAPAANIEAALERLDAALRTLTPGTMHWAGTQANLANVYANRTTGNPEDNIERGLRASEAALGVFTKESSERDWAQLQLTRARLLASRTKDSAESHRQAVKACEDALRVFTQKDYPVEHARALQYLAHIRSDAEGSGRHVHLDGAVEAARASLASIDRNAMPMAWALMQNTLGAALMKSRESRRRTAVPGAIAAFNAALEVAELKKDPRLWAGVMSNLAGAHAELDDGRRAGNVERAIQIQNEALVKLDLMTDPGSWASAMVNLATLHRDRSAGSQTDNIEYAIALAEQSLVAVSERELPELRARILEELGGFFERRLRGKNADNLERARQAYAAAGLFFNRDGTPADRTRLTHRTRGVTRSLRNIRSREPTRPDEASPSTQPLDADQFLAAERRAADEVAPEDDPRAWMTAQISLARWLRSTAPSGMDEGIEQLVVRMQPNLLEAITRLERVAHAAREQGDHLHWATVRDDIAGIYLQLHLYAELEHLGGDGLHHRAELQLTRRSEASARYLDLAIAALQEVLQVRTLSSDPHGCLQAAVTLGRSQVWKRDWAGADVAFRLAADAADTLLSNIESSDGELRRTLRALGALANSGPFCALMLNEPQRALRLLDAGRSRLLAKALSLETLPVSPEVRRELHEFGLLVAERERQLVSPWLINRMRPLREVMTLRQRMRDLLEGVDLPAALRRTDISGLLAEVTTEGSVLVVPILTEVGGRILVALSRGGAVETHVLSMTDEITLSGLFNSRIGGTSGGWKTSYERFQSPHITEAGFAEFETTLREVAPALGNAFAAPLMEGLERLGIASDASLCVIPQGALGLFPLSIAATADSGSVLLERHALSLNTSVTTAAHARTRASRARFPESVAMIAPAPGLDSTAFETRIASSFFAPHRALALQGDEATLEATLDILRGRDIWHFASHGRFDLTAPESSGIDLAHGERLTLQKLSETHGLGSPRLVVLSACETAVYDVQDLPGEFVGLSAAFLQAGACGVIATLWPVSDVASALLVARFYELFIGERQSPMRALRDAQLWLKSATVASITDTLGRWHGAGRIADSDLALMQGDVGRVARIEARRPSPFESPVHWGAFVYYGA